MGVHNFTNVQLRIPRKAGISIKFLVKQLENFTMLHPTPKPKIY